VVLHNLRGKGDFDTLLGADWPGGVAAISPSEALIVGSLLLLAAMGKSALVPFSGWLPRAMEGPTPSSAVFYGALSVHLGAYLLLRLSSLLALSIWLQGAVIVVGLLTALFAALAGRVQSDIKSALSYASLTQVGIIVAEIGFGLHWIALAHIIGHACMRTLQFLRAPTLLHDYHTLENAMGDHLLRTSAGWGRLLPRSLRIWCYRFALERCYLDAVLTDYLTQPFLRLFRLCDRMERKWTDFLSGGQSRESDRLRPSAGSLEEYA
jgi:NAD(P)H-quinone oxidoreductase subunit 5